MVFGHGVAGRQVKPMMDNILRIRDRRGVSLKKAIKRERESELNIFCLLYFISKRVFKAND